MQQHHRLPNAVSTTPRRAGSTPSGTPPAGRKRRPVVTVVPSSPWHQTSISVSHWFRVTFLPLIGSILWEGTLGLVHCLHWIIVRFVVMVVMVRVMRTVKLLFILALRGTIPPLASSTTSRSSPPCSTPPPLASPGSRRSSSSGQMAPSPTKCTLLAQELLKKKKHNRLPGGMKTPFQNGPSPPTLSSVTPRREEGDTSNHQETVITVSSLVRDGTPPLSETDHENDRNATTTTTEAAAAPISSPRVGAEERKRNRRFPAVPFMGTTTASTRLWRPKWNHPPPQQPHRIGENDPEILRGPPIIQRVRSSRRLGHRVSSTSTVGSSSSVSSSTSTLSRRMSLPRLRQRRRVSSSCRTLLEQVHDEPEPVPESSTPTVWWNKRFTGTTSRGTMPPTASMASFLNNNNRTDESVSISPSPPECIMELVFFDHHEETKEEVTTSTSQKTPLGMSTTTTRS